LELFYGDILEDDLDDFGEQLFSAIISFFNAGVISSMDDIAV